MLAMEKDTASRRLLAVGKGKSDSMGFVLLEWVSWDDLVKLSSEPIEASISHADYMALPKPERNVLKRKSPFVSFAVFREGKRRGDHVEYRSAAQIDIDADALDLFRRLEDTELTGGVVPFAYVGHTTRSHVDEEPRLRLMVPFSRDVQPAEYRPCVRALQHLLDSPTVDDASFQPSRLMYLPVVNRDAPFWSWKNEAEYVDPDYLLEVARSLPPGAKAPRDRKAEPSDDDFAAYTQPAPDLTIAQIEWLMRKLPLHERDNWLRAGRILHHQFEANDEGFDLWVELSKDDPKFDAEDQRRVWESFGSSAAPETVRSLLKEFGQPPTPREPAIPHPQATHGDPVPFIEGSQFAAGFEDVDWLIEDVLPRAQVTVIYGASGSGKTFLALDLACTIQRGLEWRGKHVDQADVFYIAAEAGAGLRKRIAAYLQVKGKGPMPWFVDYQPNLATLESVHAISESVKLRSSSAGVIFVDTLALSHDGDENSSKDMSIVLRHCKMLADETGAMVILIHHTGKDDTRGMRGSSATYAAADCVLEVSSDEKDHTIFVDKLKDGERGASYGFTLPTVEVGVTPRGKAITSCYVLDCEAKLKKGKKKGPKPLTHQAQIFIFDVFSESLGMSDSMTETELVDAVKVKQKAADNIPSQSQSIKGSINKMVISGHIRKEGESLSLPHSTHSTHSSSFE